MRMVTVMVDALLLMLLLLPMLWSWGVRGRHTRGPMQLWKWARCNIFQMMYVFSSLIISIVILKLHNFNFLLNIKKRERERENPRGTLQKDEMKFIVDPSRRICWLGGDFFLTRFLPFSLCWLGGELSLTRFLTGLSWVLLLSFFSPWPRPDVEEVVGTFK